MTRWPPQADAKYMASIIALRYPDTQWRAQVATLPEPMQADALAYLSDLHKTRAVAAAAKARNGRKP